VKDRLLLAAYAGAILLLTSRHDLRFLAAALVLLAALAGRDLPRLARRTAVAIALFNSIVTVSYAVASAVQGSFSWHYVALINLRVFTVTFLTFLTMKRVDLLRACAFSETLLHLATIAVSQTLTLRRLLTEFRLALASRTIAPLSLKDLYRHRAAMLTFLLEKSLHDVQEIGLAMKSRGFFHA
jgi:cobalt/nickel transport system permease protein